MAAVSHSSRPTTIPDPLASVPTVKASPNFSSLDSETRRDLVSRFRLSSTPQSSPLTERALITPSLGSKLLSSSTASATTTGAGQTASATATTAPATATRPAAERAAEVATAISAATATATPVAASPTKGSRSGTFLALAVAAIDRTQNALASAEQKIRPRQSLGRLSVSLDSRPQASFASTNTASFSSDHTLSSNHSSNTTAPPAPNDSVALPSPSSQAVKQPQFSPQRASQQFLQSQEHQHQQPSISEAPAKLYSSPYSATNPNNTRPYLIPRLQDKMHQTSSRLLRMTDDDRPFTKDFKDLFSTLIVSLLPLSAHRVRLTKVEHTFLSEDAINNLGSLKFSQSNRMPDPKDPTRIVTTTTTTTFSMAKDMARSICQRFLEARFIESADGRYQQVYTLKGSVWQLTPKGICILDRFCSRNGIQQKQVAELVGHATSQLVILERESQTDKIVNGRGTVEVIFRRFIGVNGLNIKNSVNSADADSLSDYRDGLTGVKMAGERKVAGKTYRDTFTGKAAVDWLMDCCTTVDRREANELASLFVEYGLVDCIQPDRAFQGQLPGVHLFQPTKAAIYQLSSKGKDLINGTSSRGRSPESDAASVAPRPGIARDSNTQRLDKILNDPALRLLFRENLRETHCEENLSFYLDVDDFVRNCRQAIRVAQKSPGVTSMDGVKEIMAQAYSIYNAFLAPGSPCELNIDHQLRNNLATRMTKAVGQDGAMIETLHEVTTLFEVAQNAVFKLMASDSVPKFLRHPKYENTLRSYDFDAIVVGSGRVPERSQSRSNRK